MMIICFLKDGLCMEIKKSIDEFYDEIKNLHKQLCPEYSFYELWTILNEEHKKVSFEKIENERILLLFKIITFNLSIDYADEKWKSIKGYDGIYEVSNKGRIRRNDNVRHVMMHYDVSPLGYKRVNLSINNTAKKFLVHRLVAEAFLDNPNDYPIINHKDEKPWNNTVENLEWCNYSYNNSYNDLPARRMKTRSKNIKNGKTKIGRPVVQLDLNDNFIKEWANAERAYVELGISSSTISACCRHVPHKKTAGGYKWIYKDEYIA